MARLQKLGNSWYAFVYDKTVDETYHIRMPDGWEPTTKEEVELVIPPTEH